MAIGYTPFFMFVMVASIPSRCVATLFAPFPVKEESREASERNAGYPSSALTASRYQAACGIHCSDQRQV